MRVTFKDKDVQLTDRDREYAEKKLEKLGRFFREPMEAHLNHAVQRNWQIVEVQVQLDGMILRAEERTAAFNTSIDAVVDKLERQISRLKKRLSNHKGRADAPTVAASLSPEALGPDEVEGEFNVNDAGVDAEAPLEHIVVRRKRFAIKPMTADKASLQMELLHHDFFAFVNAETNQVNILYRRREGGYGLLELDV